MQTLNKQFRLCLVYIMSLCIDIANCCLALSATDAVILYCIKCVYPVSITLLRYSTSQAYYATTHFLLHFPDYGTFKFPDFSMFSGFSRLVATLEKNHVTEWNNHL